MQKSALTSNFTHGSVGNVRWASSPRARPWSAVNGSSWSRHNNSQYLVTTSSSSSQPKRVSSAPRSNLGFGITSVDQKFPHANRIIIRTYVSHC